MSVDGYDPEAPTPKVGTRWVWEPDKPWAREDVTVAAVRWNGEEWWVQTDSRSGLCWNDVSRFWEAVERG